MTEATVEQGLWTGPSEDPKRYRVDAVSGVPEPIGDGGEGIVFAAVAGVGETERKVALKMLTAIPPGQYEALEARSRAIAAVDHPGLMHQIEVFLGTGLVAEGEIASSDVDVLYSAAEWVPGVPLPEAIDEVDTLTALEWVAQIAEAVYALHAHRDENTPEGIVHRDVKPSNIRVTPEGTAVLIDFGIARPHDDGDYTKASGTYGWRPPELLGGPGTPGPPIDVWGVGAIAYWVVLGVQPPLEEAAAARIRLTPPLRERFGSDAPAFANHISALLEADPAKRPVDLRRWANGLRKVLSGHARRRRHLLRAVSSVAAILVLAGVASLGVWLVAGGQGVANQVSGIAAGGNGPGRAPDQLKGPGGLAVDADANLYVADNGNDRIQKWAPGANRGITVAGSNVIPRRDEDEPWGVALDSRGNVYIADPSSDRVRKWVPGATTGVTVAGGNGAGSAANQLDGPSRNFVVDKRGNLYIVDYGNNRVQKWAPGSKKGVTVAGGNGEGAEANQLGDVVGDVAVDGKGNVYVVDYSNDRVQKWAPGASQGVTVARGWMNYAWFAVDDDGNVYYGDHDGAQVQKWTPDSTEVITVAGGNGRGRAANQLGVQGQGFVDAIGNLYIPDYALDRVQKWAPGATEGVTVAGGNDAGSAANQFDGPSEVIVDRKRNLYVADWNNSRVQRWAPGDTEGTTVAGGNDTGSAANQIGRPTKIALDKKGNLYVYDGVNRRVQKWAPRATEGVTIAEGIKYETPPNEVAYSHDWLAVDGQGNLFVSDHINSRVQKWVPGAIDGTVVAGGNGRGTAPNQLRWPTAAVVDDRGNVYVTDSGNDRVQKWSPGSQKGITVAGGHGKGAAPNQLDWPIAVDVDADGNVYVVDTGNDRVQRWAPGAKRGVTVAGGNGKGKSANQLNEPSGVAVDADGNVYVADALNFRVQKWTPGAKQGVTVAGNEDWPRGSFFPQGLTIDASGNLYISDRNEDQVWVRSADQLRR